MRLTKKKALDITIELWEWIEKTGNKYKENWPGWEKYGEMEYDCPLCEYAFHPACKKCPLQLGERGCISSTAYGNWANEVISKSKYKEYAGLFLEQLKEIRDK